MSESKASIPPHEFPERWQRIQTLMRDRQLDLVLAYADDRAVFGPAHVRWLADVPVHFEPFCVLIPKEGNPVLLCGPESDEYARLRGQMPDVRVLREFTHPDEDYPYANIQSLTEIISDLGWSIADIQHVGIGGKALISAETMQAFQQALPNVNWIDIENDLCGLRAVKSQAERAVIRQAYQIAEIGLLAAVKAIQPGVSERHVAAQAEVAMRMAGAEGTGIDTIVASGPNSRPILARTTFRQIAAHDAVLLTIAPRYEGYHGAIGRLVFVGQPDIEIEKAYRTAVQAQQACGLALRTGLEGRQVEAIGRKIVQNAGYGSYFLYSGLHSLGVIEFEPPIFGPSSDAKLQENMIISIDIPMFNTPWGGLRVEDGYCITSSGADRMNNTEYFFYK